MISSNRRIFPLWCKIIIGDERTLNKHLYMVIYDNIVNRLVLNRIYISDELKNDIGYIAYIKLCEFLEKYLNNYEEINSIKCPSIKRNILISTNRFMVTENERELSNHISYNIKHDFLYLGSQKHSELSDMDKLEQYLDYMGKAQNSIKIYTDDKLPLYIRENNDYYLNIYKDGSFIDQDMYEPIDLTNK